jgi:hypothetical protein
MTLDGERLTGFWVYLSRDVVAVVLEVSRKWCGAGRSPRAGGCGQSESETGEKGGGGDAPCDNHDVSSSYEAVKGIHYRWVYHGRSSDWKLFGISAGLRFLI